jgi:hypothetical protein
MITHNLLMSMNLQNKKTAAAAVLSLAVVACGGAEMEPSPGPAPSPGPEPAPEQLTITVSPHSGTLSSDVAIRAEGFQSGARVDIGFGPPSSEYEIVTHAQADTEGVVETTVKVPDWAETGRDYLFVARAPDGNDVVSSEFHVVAVADPDPTLSVTGRITGEGVECPALRTDDGDLYTLAGETGRFGEGDRVEVEGTIAEMSICMQGTTIEVENISDAG